MKKFFTILFATAVAALATVSCQKSTPESNENETGIKSSIHFYASEIETKTVFGDLSAGKYPTLWTANKGIKISQNEANSIDASVTPKDGDTKADFTPESPITSDGSGSYKFYALSPASAQVSNINKNYHSWNVEIPTAQTPQAGSVDESAQIISAKYDAGSTYPSSVPFAFTHVTAYGLFSLSNLALDGGETIASISLKASKNWVGRWYYYVEDYDSNDDGNPENAAGSVAPSAASNTITLITSSSSNIWFACAPVDLQGETLTVTVVTNKGTFTKNIEFPSGKGNFQAGHIAKFTINMSGVPRVSPVVYTLVTDVADLTIDSEVIIVHNTENYAAGKLGTGTFLPSCAITKSSSNINSPGETVEVFKIANGNIAGTYGLVANSNSQFLKWKEAAKVETEASVTAASSWAISITGAGVASIRNMSESSRYILYNTTSPRFSTYGPSATYTDVSIYKNYSTGTTTPITAKTLSSVSVDGQTTNFAKGSSFVFDGTVYANYSDLSSVDVTASATIDASSVNMSTVGTYDVTVSYGGKSTTYSITVSVSGGTTVYLTNAEVIAAMTAANIDPGSYGNITFSSTSGDWPAVVYRKKDLTYIQLRNKSGAKLCSPTFASNIDKVVFTISSSQTTSRKIHLVPSSTEVPTSSSAYTSTLWASQYGEVASGTGAGEKTINFTSDATSFIVVVEGGATYIDSIAVYLK